MVMMMNICKQTMSRSGQRLRPVCALAWTSAGQIPQVNDMILGLPGKQMCPQVKFGLRRLGEAVHIETVFATLKAMIP